MRSRNASEVLSKFQEAQLSLAKGTVMTSSATKVMCSRGNFAIAPTLQANNFHFICLHIRKVNDGRSPFDQVQIAVLAGHRELLIY